MSENTEPQTDSASDQAQSTQPPQASSGTSPADSDHSGDSASPDSATIGGISDDQLPEDLQPGEDNPLAEPLDPDDEATKDRVRLNRLLPSVEVMLALACVLVFVGAFAGFIAYLALTR